MGAGAQPAQLSVASTATAVSSKRSFQDLLGKRLRGTLKSIGAKGNPGLIACPDVLEVLGREVYALAEDVSNLCEGHEVSFEVVLNPQRLPQAKAVTPETFFKGCILSLDQSSGYGFISCV